MDTSLFDRSRVFLRRNWKRALRLREKIQITEEAFHLVMAGGVGVIGGLVNVFFYHAIESVKHLFLRRPGDPVEVAEMMENWQRLFIPVVGGLLAGLILHWGRLLVGPQGTTSLLEVVSAGEGRLPFRTAALQTTTSLVSIGTGASIGREGGITQLTATLASKWGQVAKWEPYRLRLLVGCGAAAGLAAAYNAPISGAVFAAMIVLGNFSMHLFAPLVFASVIASVVSRSFFGIEPLYVVPNFDFTRLSQLPWFVLLGLLSGALGAVFLMMLQWCEEKFRRLPGPIYARLALGGLIVGVIAIWFPGVWGNGYVITNRILHDQYPGAAIPLVFLGGLFLAKLLATVATVGAGTVGGVFTPTLFLGAALGSAFGMTLHELNYAEGLPTAAFALVGMAGVLSATTHSPLLAMILVFEISLNYSLMPALMLACVVSILVSRRLHRESVYTEPLRLKGLELARERTQHGAAIGRTVGDLMHAPVPPVRETTKLKDIAGRFIANSNNFLPVVNEDKQLVGVVALQDLKEYLGEGSEVGVIAYDVMRPPPPCVTPGQSLLDVLPVVLASELRNIPVVNSFKESRLIGSLVRAEVLGLVSEAISPGSESGEVARTS